MEGILIFMCTVIGTLICIFSANRNFKRGELFSAIFNTILSLVGLVLSIWAAFIYLPLWGAVLYCFGLGGILIAAAKETIKKRNNLK